MICEILNPSDAYTLECRDGEEGFVVAACTIAYVGQGQLGLRSLDGQFSTPVLFGWGAWCEQHGIAYIDEYLAPHWEEAAAILDSVLIGDERDRRLVQLELERLPEEERAAWLADYHDRQRTSLRDIGAVCHENAKRIREFLARKEAARAK